MKRLLWISFVLVSFTAVQAIQTVDAFAVNPRAFIMKERMQKAEDKLQSAENSQGKKQMEYLAEHMKIARQNIESMSQELSRLNAETSHMNHETTLAQLIAHEKKMEKYHLTVIKMLHQMVRSQSLLLNILQKQPIH